PVPDRRALGVRAGSRRRALLPQWPAAPAALPAVLARQPHRPHVGGALLDRRRAAARLAHGAAALPLPRALEDLPLVSQPARDRGRARIRRAPSRGAGAVARQARGARRCRPRAARLCQRALFASLPHRSAARPAASRPVRLEPQTAAHAEEMFTLLGDPKIYRYEGQPPASLDSLRE